MSNFPNICNKPECTYSQTGQCVLNNEPLNCPDRLESILDESILEENNLVGDVILNAPEDSERLSSSFSLTIEDSEKLMRNRYCKIIGILGIPGAGKTASLASLYLLLAHGKLEGYRFLDSKSIRAFEEITNGARRWNEGNVPDQLTAHTELQDERIAGYLHLRLENENANQKIDLLLTDLPGEWTTSLIEQNRTDRLSFLKSAERIWITLNGMDIENAGMRHLTLHRIELLIDRLKEFLVDNVPDICFVVTHFDKSSSVLNHLKSLESLAEGFDIKIFEIASFSENDNIPPGTGLDSLLDDLLQMRRMPKFEFASAKTSTEKLRHILQFKNDR